MVTRKIQGSAVKVTGVCPSGVEFESHLEEDFLTLVRFDRRVAHFCRCEEQFVWYDDDQKRRVYTPDFHIHYKASTSLQPEVIEVKPDFHEDDPRPVARLPRQEDARENELKWGAASRECGRRGWRFVVRRESEIRNSYLTNARFLLAYLERGNRDDRSAAILQAMVPGVRMTVGELIQRLGRDDADRLAFRPSLYRLLATRRLEVDLNETLCDSSVLGLPS